MSVYVFDATIYVASDSSLSTTSTDYRTIISSGDTITIATPRTITNATDLGNIGEICWDADYIYICTAQDTWKRSPLSTW